METESRTTRILVAIRPSLYRVLFNAEAENQLASLGKITCQSSDDILTSSDLANLVPGQDIVITGWGTPVFNAEVLAAADRLRLIAHTAGTIKRMLPPPVFTDSRRVTHAAAAMATTVAETTLLLIMLVLRQFHKIDRVFHEHGWAAAKSIAIGNEIAAKRIGVIGAGHTGRAVIKRLKAVEAEIWLYDPYMSEAAATQLGTRKVALEPLMRGCSIITLQAPSTAETYRMIGAEQLRWLQDGAVFINTARTHLVDEAALLAELQSGRIQAALDVFEHEPLPDDSLFRGLGNVILTPHVASHTLETRLRQGQIVTDEVADFLRAGRLRYEVTHDMLDMMA